MLDILFLAAIAYLIARIIWNTFSASQHFLTSVRTFFSTPSSSKHTSSSPKLDQQIPSKKAEEKPVQLKPEKHKKQIKVQKLPKDQTLKRQVVNEPIKQIKVQRTESLRIEQPSKASAQKTQDLFPVRLEQIEVSSKSSKLQDYEKTIKSLKEQILMYQKEKQLYVQRIEEIIQHVINQTELDEPSRRSSEDEEFNAINNLKHELNAAQHKIHEQRDIMTINFSKEKELLRREYDERLRNTQLDFNDKIKQYQATINEVTQRVQEMERAPSCSQLEVNSQRREEEHRFQGQALENQKIKQLQNQLQKARQTSRNQSQNQGQLKALQNELQNSKHELISIREELIRSQNDYLQHQTKSQAQINSLQIQNQQLTANLQAQQKKLFTIQQQAQQLKTTLLNTQNLVQKLKEQLASFEQTRTQQINLRQQIQSKLQQTHEQLKFCQQQLQNLKETESELRDRLLSARANETPKKVERPVKKQDIENSHEYKILKLELQRVKRQLSQRQENFSIAKTPGDSNVNFQERQNPSNIILQSLTTTPKKRLSPSPLSQSRKISPYTRPISTRQPQIPVSTILMSQDRRAITPVQKKIVASTINQGTISNEVYLGETQILSEGQRNFIVHEVSAIKKITVKKTRLMYSLRQKGGKSIHEFVLGAPNIILIAELQNQKIVGAFTQNAFSRENKFTKSSVVSKGMIFDVSKQVFITNEGQGEIIRCQENALIWGNKEFVVNCQEPITISVNLNCQEAVYLSNYSTAEFIGSQQVQTMKVIKLQMHRVFLG